MKNLMFCLALLWALGVSAENTIEKQLFSSRQALDGAAKYELCIETDVVGYENCQVVKELWFYSIISSDANVLIDIGNGKSKKRFENDYHPVQSFFVDMDVFIGQNSFQASYCHDERGIGYLFTPDPAGSIVWACERYSLLDKTQAQTFEHDLLRLLQAISSAVKSHEISLAATKSHDSPRQHTRLCKYKNIDNYWVSSLVFFENYERDSIESFMKKTPDTIISEENSYHDNKTVTEFWRIDSGLTLARKVISEDGEEYSRYMFAEKIGAKEYLVEVKSSGAVHSYSIKKNGKNLARNDRYVYTRPLSFNRWLMIGAKKHSLDLVKTRLMKKIYV